MTSTEGIYEAHSLEGTDFRGAFTKSSFLGWTVSLGFDRRVFDAPLWRTLLMFGGGVAVLLICALLLVRYYTRGISQPLVALSAMAAALGRGEHIPAQHLNLHEAQITADQISSAAMALEQRAREVGQLNAALGQRASALEVANKELEGFSYSTSHVLRAPLRAIDGFSQILLEEHSAGLDSEGKRLVGVLRPSAHELNEQIEGILEFLRLGRDKMCAAPLR